MKFFEVTYDDSQPIDGYGPGMFRIAGEAVEGPIRILPTGVTAWGGYEDVEGLVAAAGKVDVMLIGTGADPAFVPAGFRRALEEAGIGLEVMATPSACRTFNVLLGEGRRVGAALLPV